MPVGYSNSVIFGADEGGLHAKTREHIVRERVQNIRNCFILIEVLGLVRMKGLEPPCLAAPDPKSGASANFATSAKNIYLVRFGYVF